MTRTVRRALLRQRGPWLVRRDRLEQLDRIMAGEGIRVPAAPEMPRALEVFLDDGEKLLAASFGEALSSYPSLERGLGIGFRYAAALGAIRAVVWLEKGDKASAGATAPDRHHELVIEVTPEDEPGAQTLFFALAEWAESLQLPKAERLFEHHGGWLAVLAVAALAHSIPSAPSNELYYMEQARALLASDGAVLDQARAVQLLLSIASRAPAPSAPSAAARIEAESYAWLLVAIFCSFAALFVARSPAVLLGLGRGEARIALWARGRTFLIYSAPGAALTWLVLPIVLKRLGIG
jgi:hypothetical protein